jgi:hypothetical protein
VKEQNMPDNDQQMRTLLAVAAGDVPPGIDLLHGLRARQAARHIRGRAALAAAAACVVAAATAVTLTIVQAPSALAQLTSAVSRTAGQSYHFSATITSVPLQANDVVAVPLRHVSGAFDPPQRVGEETLSPGGQFRFIGGYVYRPTDRAGRPALPWVKAPSPQLWAPVTASKPLRITAGILSVAETSPQDLFAMLKSASTVDRQGSVSGPGWTGTSYAFSVSIVFGQAESGLPAVTATGTVDVDKQGRVRHLNAAYTLPATASAPTERVTAETTFSDFGAPVPVSAPPASEVLTQPRARI